ncbi:MAG: mannose-1-phosphate guanylyltransferase/mannose-6-phosphate isomerase [Alphaproteobacteria bacterium]|nr:mannose-1-phosphate guanylyltransferase/mannose-6-phosphate isomerase [Alphaproteobacteria bacterium]
MKIQPVIMSGGSGTRLWPMSRKALPKQFLKLVTDRTMFQDTVSRVCGKQDSYGDPVVICGAHHGPIVAKQLAEIAIQPADIILEPCPRNTAAVAAAAAAWVARGDEDALILLMPADHHIADGAGFRSAVALGAKAAEAGNIVTFGIAAQTPHTGYGYIETGAQLFPSVYKAAAFKEKPDRETAERYIKDGRYYWNAGIFLYRASAMRDEMARLAPEIMAAASEALEKAAPSDGALRLDEAAFSACPSDSVDYAVMEKTDKAAIVAPVDVGWTDIGSWSEVASADNSGNVICVNATNNIIRSDGPLIAAAGVEDLIIVATGDAVLVARSDNAQDVRAIVEELKKRGLQHLL